MQEINQNMFVFSSYGVTG